MKKILTFATIATIGLATFSSCKKSDSSPSYSMTATAGSTSFNTPNVTFSTLPGVGTDSALIITGVSSSGFPDITLEIVNWNHTTGTTTFDSLATNGIADYVPNSTTIEPSASGSVVLTSVSASSISGTFSFTGTSGTAVTNGKFTAKRQ